MAGLLFALALVAPASAENVFWVGGAGDNLWSNPDNWLDGAVPTSVDEVRVNGPEAEGGAGPLIADGVEAIVEKLVADFGNPVINMTGGSLELAGWGTWWGDASGTTATFNMSGGVVDFTGGPGIMELGWQDQADPPGTSIGIWEMTGGEVNAQGLDMPGKGYGGVGVVNLHGGTINVGTSRGGLILYEGAQFDIAQGMLVLEGDQTVLVEDYIDAGWMTAYGGQGELSVVFDGDYTTVVGNPGGPVGDFNLNGTLDAADLDLLTAEVNNGPDNLTFDLNSDGTVDHGDRDVWIKDLKNTWFGDADLDGEFNSADFVTVFQAGEYEDAMVGNSTWSTGDWNGDAEFDSGDFVAAFQDGGYEAGPRAATAAVPEPSASVLLLIASGLLAARARRWHMCR